MHTDLIYSMSQGGPVSLGVGGWVVGRSLLLIYLFIYSQRLCKPLLPSLMQSLQSCRDWVMELAEIISGSDYVGHYRICAESTELLAVISDHTWEEVEFQQQLTVFIVCLFFQKDRCYRFKSCSNTLRPDSLESFIAFTLFQS